MLMHAFAMTTAAMLSIASGPINHSMSTPGSAATMSVPSTGQDAMSLESILARLEQVAALREIAIRTGQTNRLSDLDALEARLFAMAEQAVNSNDQRPATAFVMTDSNEPSVRRAAPSQRWTNAVPQRQGSLPLFQHHDADADNASVEGRRRVAPIFVREAAEHSLLLPAISGEVRRTRLDNQGRPLAPMPAIGAFGEGQGPAIGGSGRRQVTERVHAPGMGPDSGLTVSADAARNTSIDTALRELRSTIASVDRR